MSRLHELGRDIDALGIMDSVQEAGLFAFAMRRNGRVIAFNDSEGFLDIDGGLLVVRWGPMGWYIPNRLAE